MKKSKKLNENFYLVKQDINNDVMIEVAKAVNHIIVIDVSGSMCYDLPEIRKNLKNKISNLIKKDDDTITIIWFSGNNEAGILKEAVSVNTLKQLNDLNDAIDKYLKPIGMTAFAKPIELAKEVIDRINKINMNSIFSLIFMSDGYNNSVAWSNVVKALNEISPSLASSTIVEYGFYCDSRKLTEMATILGGEKISCSGFDEYDVVIDKSLNKSIYGGKKTLVEITDKYLYDFAFSVSNGSVLLYGINDGKILVGSDVNEIYYFTPNQIGTLDSVLDMTYLYAAIYVLSDKLLSDEAEKIFYALGDGYYYKMLANAFGKQKLNDFKSAIKECVIDATKRFPEGASNIIKVDDDAYCLMNLIEDLGNIEGCSFYPNHPDFVYNKIGRKRVAVGSTLNETDKKRLSEAKDVTEATEILKELEEKKVDIKFVNSNPDRPYPLTDLIWNEERANLSVRIYIEGEAILPTNKFGIDKVTSFKYNTFTLIKDGIINVSKLPINIEGDDDRIVFLDSLKDNGVKYSIYNAKDNYDNTIVIDLTSLPIINKGMVKSISADLLAKKEWELIKLQADKKVYDYYKKSLFPKTSKSYVEMLGQECADWLKEIGITDFNGFAPKTTAAPSTDFYMSVNLITKIKGLSSLPKVEDVVKKIESNTPLKLNELVMSDAIKKYLSQTKSDMFLSLNEEQQKGVLKTYLETKSNILNKQKRKIMQNIAEIKFSLIISKKWFTEFKSFDENKLSINIDGQDLDFTFDLIEKEEKI